MKHLLNDLTEQEKNSIREQYKGEMKIVTENFSKLINTKSGDVKPLVNEGDDYTNNGVMAFNTIKKAMEGIGTDEEGVLRGVLMIKTKEDYNTALSLCQKEKIGISNHFPKTIMEYISSDMTYDTIKPNNSRGIFSNRGRVGFANLLTNQYEDRRLLVKMKDHLNQFNQNETIIRA